MDNNKNKTNKRNRRTRLGEYIEIQGKYQKLGQEQETDEDQGEVPKRRRRR